MACGWRDIIRGGVELARLMADAKGDRQHDDKK